MKDPTSTVTLTPVMEVPANSSRFFAVREQALQQPTSLVELVWENEDPYVRNARFAADAIRYDDSYCTSLVNLDQVVQLPTAGYFQSAVMPHAPAGARVVDIGCGQGEFVNHLRAQGVDAVGYDPVLKESSDHLRARYWTSAEERADVFVMRCVLPHIPQPWRFLENLGDANPGALVLVEFQRLEWILGQSVWYQISHDHVNVFSVRDFEARFNVVDHGTFSHGEWAWVLVRADTYHPAAPARCDVTDDFSALMAARESALSAGARSSRALCVWGAAGKGIVLAHALVTAGAPLVAAVDADPLRQERFMEVSGTPILAPEEAERSLPPGAVMLVCNPNHVEEITASNLTTREVIVPKDLPRHAMAAERLI